MKNKLMILGILVSVISFAPAVYAGDEGGCFLTCAKEKATTDAAAVVAEAESTTTEIAETAETVAADAVESIPAVNL